MKFLLKYVQPRSTIYGKPIFEIKERVLVADSKQDGLQQAQTIIAEGAIVCGGLAHYRSFVSLDKIPLVGTVPEPIQGFLPTYPTN